MEMIEAGIWEGIKTAINWVMVPISALMSYVLYKHKKAEQKLEDLGDNVHKLEVSHEISVVEIREIKQDIKDINHNLERIADKLWRTK